MPKRIKATVKWFDNLSQEGMIRLPDGSSVYVNNDPVHGYLLNGGSFQGLFMPAIQGKPYELKQDQKVIVEIFEDSHFRQVSYMRVV